MALSGGAWTRMDFDLSPLVIHGRRKGNRESHGTGYFTDWSE